MRPLTNTQSTIAILAAWLGVFIVLWLVWAVFGPENRWWTTAIYAVVIAAAGLFTIKMTQPKPAGGTADRHPEQSQPPPGA
jgi:hypothetical protein